MFCGNFDFNGDIAEVACSGNCPSEGRFGIFRVFTSAVLLNDTVRLYEMKD
jgi:hypothetical protein